jgi:hypothetical protein
MAYTESAWRGEYEALAKGEVPMACEDCGRTGFYGPRGNYPDGPGRRACKFCGFWQRVGEEPFTAIPTVHICGNGSPILGAPQIWWEVPENRMFDCRYCPAKGLSVENWQVSAPRDEPRHPWWEIPQGLSQEEYRQFWAARESWLEDCMPYGYL